MLTTGIKQNPVCSQQQKKKQQECFREDNFPNVSFYKLVYFLKQIAIYKIFQFNLRWQIEEKQSKQIRWRGKFHKHLLSRFFALHLRFEKKSFAKLK